MAKKQINVGLIGCGTVGLGVIKLFEQNSQLINDAAGIAVNLKKVCDSRDVSAPNLTKNVDDILIDPDIDIVIESIGGVDPAKDFILSAINSGKNVVTPNKEVIAKFGHEIMAAANSKGVDVMFEGSVGGGIPIIKPLRESLAANHIQEIFGIVNGTTNYILSKMTELGKSFNVVLDEAKAKGFAESNPASDIDGLDAAYKAIILAAVAFNRGVSVSEIHIEGISKVTLEDIRYAAEIGYSIKLLAVLKRVDDLLDIRVHPTLVPSSHPLAAVSDANNAIYVKGDAVGELMFYGPGAGSLPTASSIMSDVIDISKKIACGGAVCSKIRFAKAKVKNIGDVISRYYVRFSVPDQPGVLAKIAGIFGSYGASIQAAIQKETIGDIAQLVIIIHNTKEKNISGALSEISKLPGIEIANMIRVGLD